MDICRDDGFLDHPFVFLATFLRTIQILSLLELQAWFRKQAQCRHQCRIAEIEVEANTKIRRSLMGRSRPKRGDYVLGDANSSGEQVKESISCKDTRTDPQETWVLKAAIRGSHTQH